VKKSNNVPKKNLFYVEKYKMLYYHSDAEKHFSFFVFVEQSSRLAERERVEVQLSSTQH
jgi:hypothetical protein